MQVHLHKLYIRNGFTYMLKSTFFTPIILIVIITFIESKRYIQHTKKNMNFIVIGINQYTPIYRHMMMSCHVHRWQPLRC